MKYSIYNTYLDISPRIGCIYNSFTDSAVVFDGRIDIMEGITALPEKLNQQFIESGIIVDESTDESAKYIEWARKVENADSYFHLLLNPTLNCNFHCHYCYESHFSSKMDQETMSRIEKFVVRQFTDGKDLTVSFFGGEPMLYYEDIMKPLIGFSIEKAKEYGQSFSCNMTSNGYLLNEERVNWLCDHSFTSAQITLDGSKDIHNNVRYRYPGDNTYDRIVENIKLLARSGISVTLRLNCTGDNINSLSDISQSFDDLSEAEKGRITVDMHVVWQEKNKNDVISRMDGTVISFRDNGIKAAKSDFRGFCYADRRNSCLVNYNGDIYKCTARDFATTPRDGYIDKDGVIVWENDSLEKRMRSKFRNPHCHACRIFPLCHGGCSTNSLENHDYCMHGFSESEKDEVVKTRIVRNSTINSNA